MKERKIFLFHFLTAQNITSDVSSNLWSRLKGIFWWMSLLPIIRYLSSGSLKIKFPINLFPFLQH